MNIDSISIRDYKTSDESDWLRCRVLSFLGTAYFDDVLREKEHYEADSIELVAILGDKVVGLIDIELETIEKEIFGTIWHVAVHPDYYRQGIGRMLLAEAKKKAILLDMARLEAWTRDTRFVNEWYRDQGFKLIETYYHIFPNSDEIRRTAVIQSPHEKAYPVSGYLHYMGNDMEYLSQFKRYHQCRRYDLVLLEVKA